MKRIIITVYDVDGGRRRQTSEVRNDSTVEARVNNIIRWLDSYVKNGQILDYAVDVYTE